ncbi:DUF6531 domain-containing protein [Streptomyces platensis]|uniref:DUF6531 domain-containing protein n=1 Tax=Streptomyces platensis TaxID=58346 RepID=UPI00378C832E
MGVVLPGWADELLDLIGVSWPNVDEDDYREMANAMREFSDDIDEGASEAHTAIQNLVSSAGGSLAVEALNAHWGKINGQHLKAVADCGRMAATAMDGVAILVEGAKIGALVQLGILAAEVVAAQAAAPFTLGLSELGALGATQATRMILKRLFKEACQQVAEQVVSIALTPVEEALAAMVGDLVVQLGANAVGVQDGVNVGHAAKAGKEGFSQGVQDAKSSAEPAVSGQMKLLSAGGRRGGGSGLGGGSHSGGGSGGFSFDKDEHDRAVTSLESVGGTFRNKAGGKIGRAKSHHGRTRGKDAIADAANVMLDKVIDGIEDAVKKTAKHLDDNMTRGIKQMAKNHHDNDKGLAEHFKGLGKNDKKDSKAPHASAGKAGVKGAGGPSGRAREATDADPHGSSRPQDSVCSNGTDPIDLATGKMYLPQTDVELPGVLPLVFRRRVESGYRAGKWFGPSWTSTADQRLEIDSRGLIFVHEDGLLLAYPHPQDETPVLPVEGPRWPMERTSEGGYTVSDPASGITWCFSEHTESVALLDEISDRNGNFILFEYDADGAPTGIQHGAGYHLKLVTEEGRICGIYLTGASPQGSDQLLTSYSYTHGNLTAVSNSLGLPLQFSYDHLNRVESWTDTNNRSYHYRYDDQDRCIAESGEAGHMSLRVDYGDRDESTGLRVTTTVSGSGHVRKFHINRANQVVAEIDAAGGVTRTERDRHHRLVSTTDPLGRTTSFAYDEAGNTTSATRPDGRTATVAYNDLNLPVQIVGPDGGIWRYGYDERGNRTSVTDPSGASTQYVYDGRGNLAAVTDALGHTTLIECNRAGLPVTETSPRGAITRYERDAFGRITAVTDPLGLSTQLVWTVEGKLAAHITADGTRELWVYDGEGNCTSHVDALGGVTQFTYTHFDKLATRTGPDGAQSTYSYDAELQLSKVTNAQGLEWSYSYDPEGRLISETDFDGATITYAYDAASQLISRTNALGQTISYEHDVLGQVTEKTLDGVRTSFTYNSAGYLVHAASPDVTMLLERDAMGRVTSETVNGRTLLHAYDAQGRRTFRRTPMGTESQWRYDPVGNPIQLMASGHEIRFQYDAAGREVGRHLGDDLAFKSTWGSSGRLIRHTVSTPSLTLQQRSYTYRQDGHLTAVEDNVSGTRRFDVDEVGRVTGVHARNWSESYAYDEAGNQTSADWPAKHPGAEARGPRAIDGTKVGRAGNVRYEHDAQGRVVLRQKTRLSRRPDTWHYEWDGEDRLIAVITPDGTRWRYVYDPLGRRIAKRRLTAAGETAEETAFSWDGVNLAEQTTTSAAHKYPVTLTWDHDGLHPITQTERITALEASQGEIDQRFFAIVTDLVGTPTELVDLRGEVAWQTRSTLWGTTAWTSSSTAYTPLRFPGQYFDAESGLHYNFHRYYDPETARYATTDPLGLKPAPNPATYVANPHTWADPLGLAPEEGCPDKLKPGEMYIYRAVMPGELGDIMGPGNRRYRNGPGQEVKYFSETPEGAAAYARGAYHDFGKHDGYQPYTLTRAVIRRDVIPPENYLHHLADEGVDSPFILNTDQLRHAGRVSVLPSMPHR